MDDLRKLSSRFPILTRVSELTGNRLKPEHCLLVSVLLVTVLTLSSRLGPLLTSTFGIILPLKETLTVLKQTQPQKDELRHLLIFWLFFGLVTVIDAYTPFVAIVPFFYTMKLGFLLYAGPLRFNAGKMLYEKVLAHIPESYYKFEGTEEFMARAARIATDAYKEAKEKAPGQFVKAASGSEAKKEE